MANKANPAETSRLGAKVRAFRRRENLSQTQLAERLGISGSYLNLIESNRRPLPAGLLIKLAQQFGVDLQAFATDDDARLSSDLLEVFADPLFEGHGLTSVDVREIATGSPPAARAVMALYRAYQSARDSGASLATRISQGEDGVTGVDISHVPSEEVSDLIQKHMNHFPELEDGAEEIWKKAKLDREEVYAGLVRYLEKAHGVQTRIARWGADRGVVRRFDPEKKILTLSELLPTRGRIFQIAHQIGLLTQHTRIDRLVHGEPILTSDDSRALARVALANYFAGAVSYVHAAFPASRTRRALRHRRRRPSIPRRLRAGVPPTSTLRRRGRRRCRSTLIRIDVAGNISKRFSASGIRFARFSGACPRWNIFHAFMTPGMVRIQTSRMPDGLTYFCIARTVHKDSGGCHAQQPVQSLGLGCRMEHARELVYSDGVDLENTDMTTPVGVTCRLCERTDCEQRAFPSLRHPLQVDENVRGVSLYTPASSMLRVLT